MILSVTYSYLSVKRPIRNLNLTQSVAECTAMLIGLPLELENARPKSNRTEIITIYSILYDGGLIDE